MEIPSQTAGFAPITDSLLFTLEFSVPEECNLENLGTWLVEALEIPRDKVSFIADKGGSEQLQAEKYLKCCLLLSQLNLQTGRVPVFDEPQIMLIKNAELNHRQYSTTVSLPFVDQVPQRVYGIALSASLDICRFMSINPLSEKAREKVYGSIVNKIVRPIQQQMKAGKSTIPVLRVVHSKGIPFLHLGSGIYQLGWGSNSRRMVRSVTDRDPAIGSALSQDKVMSANLLRNAGLPAPVHSLVVDEKQALEAALAIGYPIVVKPSDRDRGEGVTINIHDETELKAAHRKASVLAGSQRVIVEKQVEGICHRLFIANSKLLYSVKRLPMSVTADGRRTVKELVESEVDLQNRKPPWSRSEIKPIDGLAIDSIQAAGFDLGSKPEKGTLVPLRPFETTEWGGVDVEVTESVSPENLEIAVNAARIFGLHVAGVDIITPDISVPWYENGAIINEVNCSPLFGGGEISRRYIPPFIQSFIEGDGKIPIEFFKHDQMDKAMERQGELVQQGIRCFLSAPERTITPNGKELVMSTTVAGHRTRALLFRPDVDAIVVVNGAEA